MTSTLPDHLRPIVGDMSVSVDEQGQLVDSGGWREIGVTHWHLVPAREWAVNDTTRFDTERMRAEQVRSSAGVAKDPQAVTACLTETQEKILTEYTVPEDVLRQSGIATPEPAGSSRTAWRTG